MIELDGNQLLEIIQIEPERPFGLSSRRDEYEDTEINRADEGECLRWMGTTSSFEVTGRIPLPEDHGGGVTPQARQYTTFNRLMQADTMKEVFP